MVTGITSITTRSRFGMYYVEKENSLFDIQSHHRNLHRFVYNAAKITR